MNEVRNILIGVIIVVILSTAGISMMSQVNSYNPRFLENNSKLTAVNNTFFNMSGEMEKVGEETDALLNTNSSSGVFGFIDNLAQSVTSTFKQIGSSMKFINAFSQNIDAWLPIPSWLGGLFVTILAIIIGFAIIKAVLKVS